MKVPATALIILYALAFFCINVAVAGEDSVTEGFRLLQGGQAAEALRSFNKALESNPDNLKAHEGMAYAYSKLGYHSLAGWHADRRMILAPQDRAWRQRRALLLFDDQSRRAEALSEARQLVGEEPNDIDSQYLLGRLLAWTGENAEARQRLEFVLDRTPDNVGALHTLARMENIDHNYEKALDLLERAVKIKSDDAELNSELADARMLSQRFRSVRYEPTIATILALIGCSIAIGQTATKLTPRSYGSILAAMIFLAVADLVWLHMFAIR